MIVKFLNKSIRTKIFLAILLPIALVESCLFYLYFHHLTNDFILRNEITASIISTPFLTAINKKLTKLEYIEDRIGFLTVYAELKGSIEFASWKKQYKNLIGVSFVDNAKQILVATPGLESQDDFFSIPESISSYRYEKRILVSVPLLTDGKVLGALNFWFSDKDVIQEQRKISFFAGTVFLVSLIVGSVLAWLLSTAITKPINNLTSDSERIASGELDHDMCLSDTSDEIGLLSRNFRAMRDSIRDKIEELEKRNRQLAKEVIERKKTAEALKASEIKFRDLSELLPQIIFETNAENNITYTNHYGIESLGYSQIDLDRGLPLSEILHPDDLAKSLENINKGISGEGLSESNEYRIIRKNGSSFDGLIYSALRIGDGSFSGVRGVLVDISERKNLENQLRQSQKMEAVGQLAGGIAHDFNNMLGAIMGAAELLGFHIADNPKVQKYQEMILGSAKRAAGLTKKLLEFSRKTPSTFATIDVHNVLEEVVALLENTIDRQITVNVDLGAAVSTIMGDSDLLQSCFLNLGINAAHAMPEGGFFSISSKVTGLDETYCDISHFDLEPGEYLEVTIKDTGSGIPPEAMLKIFEPFFTTKEQGKGTGLGLASVYGCIQQHHGAITVSSEVDRGSSFQIFLPLVDTAADYKVPEKQELIHGAGRVLVVDDETIMRIVVKTMLEKMGYDVVLAENGREGLALFKEEPAAYDLVILDMIMPELNGRQCFFEMKKLRKDICVLLSSGFIQKDDLLAMEKEGLCGLIRKPFQIAELSHVIHNALAGEESP